MKRCPSCHRTYADETMSFCLADGSLLSAPYQSFTEDAPSASAMKFAPAKSKRFLARKDFARYVMH